MQNMHLCGGLHGIVDTKYGPFKLDGMWLYPRLTRFFPIDETRQSFSYSSCGIACQNLHINTFISALRA